MDVISSLVSEMELLLNDDDWELRRLLRESELGRWEKHAYSQEVLNMILKRYRDHQLDRFFQDVCALRTPADWNDWVHHAELNGIDVKGWLRKFTERIYKQNEGAKQGAGILLEDMDGIYRYGLIRLWLGEEKTQVGLGRLFKE